MLLRNRIFIVVLFALFALFSCKKETTQKTQISSLDQWCGTYIGTSHFWSTYPKNGVMTTNRWEKDVSVEVQKGSTDSTLNFAFTYDDTIFSTRNDIDFSEDYMHSSINGGGSSGGTLDIKFSSDSVLIYHLFEKCGIPCSSGEDFEIVKQ